MKTLLLVLAICTASCATDKTEDPCITAQRVLTNTKAALGTLDSHYDHDCDGQVSLIDVDIAINAAKSCEKIPECG